MKSLDVLSCAGICTVAQGWLLNQIICEAPNHICTQVMNLKSATVSKQGWHWLPHHHPLDQEGWWSKDHSHSGHRDAIPCVQHCWYLAPWTWGEQPARYAVICLQGPQPIDKLPRTYLLCPAHRPQTEQKLTSHLTNWLGTKWELILHMTCIPCVHKPSLISTPKSCKTAFDLPFKGLFQ